MDEDDIAKFKYHCELTPKVMSRLKTDIDDLLKDPEALCVHSKYVRQLFCDLLTTTSPRLQVVLRLRVATTLVRSRPNVSQSTLLPSLTGPGSADNGFTGQRTGRLPCAHTYALTHTESRMIIYAALLVSVSSSVCLRWFMYLLLLRHVTRSTPNRSGLESKSPPTDPCSSKFC